jgi:hypothetical protein
MSSAGDRSGSISSGSVASGDPSSVSLEELAINEDVATAVGFEALIALKRLKAVHVSGPADDQTDKIKADKLRRRAHIGDVTLGHAARQLGKVESIKMSGSGATQPFHPTQKPADY